MTEDGYAVEQAVGLGEPVLTRLDVSEIAGVSLETSRQLWRALGFADVDDDARIFTAADADMLRAAAGLVDGAIIDPDLALQNTRVLGQSLARVADAQAAGFAPILLEDRVTALRAVEGMHPVLESFLTYVWRRHLAAALQREMLGAAEGTATPVAVGFADLVGFTAASQQASDHELASMVQRFEALAYDTVATYGGSVIKMIGDEVMFTTDDATSAARAGLDIAASCEADELIPSARVGIAWGRALRHQADLFGPTVNLASRLVHVALPGTALVSEELARALRNAPELEVRRLRPRRLRGLGEVAAWVVRRPGQPG